MGLPHEEASEEGSPEEAGQGSSCCEGASAQRKRARLDASTSNLVNLSSCDLVNLVTTSAPVHDISAASGSSHLPEVTKCQELYSSPPDIYIVRRWYFANLAQFVIKI